jgi:uncharacterized protein YceK
MTRTALLAFAATIGLLSSGCGTVLNLLDENPTAYGGLRKGEEFYRKQQETSAARVGIGNLVLDFLLTLIADTLTLPLIPLLPHNPLIGDGPFYTFEPANADSVSVDNGPAVISIGSPCPIDVNRREAPLQKATDETTKTTSSPSVPAKLLAEDPMRWNGIRADSEASGSDRSNGMARSTAKKRSSTSHSVSETSTPAQSSEMPLMVTTPPDGCRTEVESP